MKSNCDICRKFLLEEQIQEGIYISEDGLCLGSEEELFCFDCAHKVPGDNIGNVSDIMKGHFYRAWKRGQKNVQ